jgi:hypothetical protein
MDRKERKAGDPFGGAPMKRLEVPSQLPAPPSIEEEVKPIEAPAQEEERQCPLEWRDLRCGCGMKYEDCNGTIAFTKDQLFTMIAAASRGP